MVGRDSSPASRAGNPASCREAVKVNSRVKPHRAVREALSETAVPVVEPFHRGGQRSVGVRIVLEDTPDDLERRPPRGSDHRAPRRNSS